MDRPLQAFELWQTSPPPVGAGPSFAVGATSEAPLWRLDLGADRDGARLAGLEDQVRQAQKHLGVIPDRLDQLLRQTSPDPGGAVSFSVASASGVALPDAERDLLQSCFCAPPAHVRSVCAPPAHVRSVCAPPARRAAQSEVSFAATPTLDLGRARDELERALRRLAAMLIHLAQVETLARGRLVGRTAVGWSGRTRTVVAAGLTPKKRDLHRRNVSLAVASRLALLRTLVTVQQIAAKLSMLSVTGGISAVAALPMAWRYVRKILAESQSSLPGEVGLPRPAGSGSG